MDDDWGDWRGGWEQQRDFYRKVWSRATAAERLQMLEQMRELARQTGALKRATDAKLAEARRGWES
ncbi:MAG: hypothetical protein QOF63_2445 [Thermoanaerobaculia bacterium]|jgi:hypothetical protein|nr:hypothetical protein [Thermoanaerobaculia bacterium]MEA2414720.1 hypothetical protein [Thermoanaerobaculia bacterium]